MDYILHPVCVPHAQVYHPMVLSWYLGVDGLIYSVERLKLPWAVNWRSRRRGEECCPGTSHPGIRKPFQKE